MKREILQLNPGEQAQVAIQQGRCAEKLLHRRIVGNPAPHDFSYFDKGSMAAVGKGFAVLQSGKLQISGLPAWLAWVGVHLQFLATSSLHLAVFLQWAWTYVTGQWGDQLIVAHDAQVCLRNISTLNDPDAAHLVQNQEVTVHPPAFKRRLRSNMLERGSNAFPWLDSISRFEKAIFGSAPISTTAVKTLRS